MGNFSRNRSEHYTNFKDVIDDIITEFNDGSDITIVVPYSETSTYIKSLFATCLFDPYCLDFANAEYNGYQYEYFISLMHGDKNDIYVEPAYVVGKDRYNYFDVDATGIAFISSSVSKDLYDDIVERGHNTVLIHCID